MVTMGAERYRKTTAAREAFGTAANTDWGSQVTKQAIVPVANALREWMAGARKKAGQRHSALPFLEQVEPELVAWFGLQSILDGAIKSLSIQSVAIAIGRRVNDEVRFNDYATKMPDKFEFSVNLMNEGEYRAMVHRRYRLMVKCIRAHGLASARWSQAQRLHTGMVVIEMIRTATGLIEIEDNKGSRRAIKVIPAQALLDFIDRTKSKNELLRPEMLPAVCPPKDWTTPFDGGYHTIRRKLLKVRNKNYFREIRGRDLSKVYGMVNIQQATGWRVNDWVLDQLKTMIDVGYIVDGVPPKQDGVPPPKPKVDTGPEFIKWKILAGKIWHANLQAKSQRISLSRLVWIAERFRSEPTIYFPCQLDFRGRVYYMPNGLQPQGSDVAKGLLTFAKGKPLGERGAWWLAVHVSNTFGNDKVSLQSRVDWTNAHDKEIAACGEDPINNTFWTTADQPFQFLAACREWYLYRRRGVGYECSLPIMVDGTCSGIQHYAAMTRDASSGGEVNLIPRDKPADIYGTVAKRVVEKLRADSTSSATVTLKSKRRGEKVMPVALMAQAFLEHPFVNRKVTKRQVMVLPYGGTYASCRSYTQLAVTERCKELGIDLPGGEWGYSFSNYLASRIWEAMNETVVGPVAIMQWLRKHARKAARLGVPMAWEVPTGLPVVQNYCNLEQRRLKTRLGERLVYLRITEEADGIDVSRSSTAFPPNFVHSLDAAALMLTAVALQQEHQIECFVSVHDCYGTLAPDMDHLSRVLRREFVTMYLNTDVLAAVHDSFVRILGEEEVEPLPPKGSLDLQDVIHSEFFFA